MENKKVCCSCSKNVNVYSVFENYIMCEDCHNEYRSYVEKDISVFNFVKYKIVDSTRKKIDVMESFANGAELEIQHIGDYNWNSCDFPMWNWNYFNYRVKK